MSRTCLPVRAAVLAAFVAFLASPAEAGPPLLCHPFEPGAGAALLPWGDSTTNWNAPDATYDRHHLVRDTLHLLSPDAPVLARMENLRRAAIYAAGDRQTAADLLSTLVSRARRDEGTTRVRAMAWFDAGYAIETYRQVSQIAGRTSDRDLRSWTAGREPAEDGYAMVRRALELTGGDATIEYAASLMTTGPTAAEHHRRAAAMARADVLLARHLAR